MITIIGTIIVFLIIVLVPIIWNALDYIIPMLGIIFLIGIGGASKLK